MESVSWEEKQKLRERHKTRSFRLIVGWIALVIILVPVITQTYRDIVVDYRYRKLIGGHLENALDGSTPEIMREELLKAKQAMIDETLEQTDYGAFWYWQQTPDYRMDFTYRYIDGLINRTEFVMQWRNTYINATTTQTLKDVYDEMLANLRTEYHRRGPIDWAAYPAWLIKNHTLWYFHFEILLIYEVVAIILLFYIIIKRWSDYEKI